MIVEVVHQASHTLDTRHFAEEYIRRRKLADKGIVESAHAASPGAHLGGEKKSSAGGEWSEVAKKGPQQSPAGKMEEGSTFRVVAAKKKGGKR
jgi:PERQ amino acid-rich with GYF domain-containing protein